MAPFTCQSEPSSGEKRAQAGNTHAYGSQPTGQQFGIFSLLGQGCPSATSALPPAFGEQD